MRTLGPEADGVCCSIVHPPRKFPPQVEMEPKYPAVMRRGVFSVLPLEGQSDLMFDHWQSMKRGIRQQMVCPMTKSVECEPTVNTV
jgi:hypothetical protein